MYTYLGNLGAQALIRPCTTLAVADQVSDQGSSVRGAMSHATKTAILAGACILLGACNSIEELCHKHSLEAELYWEGLSERLIVFEESQPEDDVVTFGPIEFWWPPDWSIDRASVKTNNGLSAGAMVVANGAHRIHFEERTLPDEAFVLLKTSYPDDYILASMSPLDRLHYLPLESLAEEIFPTGISRPELKIDAMKLGPVDMKGCKLDLAGTERRSIALAHSEPYSMDQIGLIPGAVGYWETDELDVEAEEQAFEIYSIEGGLLYRLRIVLGNEEDANRWIMSLRGVTHAAGQIPLLSLARSAAGGH